MPIQLGVLYYQGIWRPIRRVEMAILGVLYVAFLHGCG